MKNSSNAQELQKYTKSYKLQIVEMVEAQEDALLLQQIYTILVRRKRKAGA